MRGRNRSIHVCGMRGVNPRQDFLETEKINGCIRLVWLVCAVAASLVRALHQDFRSQEGKPARARFDPSLAWHPACHFCQQRIGSDAPQRWHVDGSRTGIRPCIRRRIDRRLRQHDRRIADAGRRMHQPAMAVRLQHLSIHCKATCGKTRAKGHGRRPSAAARAVGSDHGSGGARGKTCPPNAA